MREAGQGLFDAGSGHATRLPPPPLATSVRRIHT